MAPIVIRITRSECPKLLTDNKEKWDQAVAAGRDSHCMKHGTEITDTLRSDARIKCMYCEGRSSGFEIEHIKPFSKHKILAHVWTNLGWICPTCNKKKLNTEGFIDPYSEDPRTKIGFNEYVAHSRDENSASAAKTVKRILNNEETQRRRKLALENFVQLYSTGNQDTLNILEKYRNPEKDFSSMFADYLDSLS